ncbi:PREDICTED: G kinase-anchoring protein 1-A-like [Amphimedon queenslandica]|uniref:G kinase-anchoring protein 1 n=1 Tax=Amphimedon queenslandica TaxID=400682 RepID=A0A1X7UYF0_AMPQE|nr:PREDICTED: G kinase-anchoring protein 1-A-like [Amphimedon queenslandica]|eukprot:XP_019851687.1 PREDICTED: G kinase-anchoring protein 1-A-like [Amphimedon queenslandica]
MARSFGIAVHESRFSVIAPPDVDTSDEDDEGWVTRSRGKKDKKPLTLGAGSRTNGASSKPAIVSKTSVKNAKRRAKKKNQQTTMESSSFESWAEKDEAITDKAFEEDMKEALLRSLMDAKREEAEKLKEEEFINSSVTGQEQQSASKKGVKMSLHEFLQSDAASPGAAAGSFLPQDNKTVSEPQLAQVKTDSHFFSNIESEVKSELMKEKKRIDHVSNTGSKKQAGEPVRVAQLLNKLEQKEATIREQTLELEKVQDEMKEVKFRNQVLCKILSKGEFSTKQELLEQIEELTADKTELSQEIERLVSELEQERSKNKSLQIVINKLQQSKH